MAAPDTTYVGYFLDALGALAVAAVLGIWRMVTGKASKAELTAAIEEFRKTNIDNTDRLEARDKAASEGRQHIYRKLDALTDRIDGKLGEMARDVGGTMIGLSGLKAEIEALKREADQQERRRRD